MTRDYDPDDPVVGDEQVVDGDAALKLLQGFKCDKPHAYELWAALSKPQSGTQLDDEFDHIPVASVYRILRQLEAAGLIEPVEPIPLDRGDSPRDGSRTYYRRIHDQLLIHAVDDEPAVVVSERPPYDPKRRLDEVNRDV